MQIFVAIWLHLTSNSLFSGQTPLQWLNQILLLQSITLGLNISSTLIQVNFTFLKLDDPSLSNRNQDIQKSHHFWKRIWYLSIVFSLFLLHEISAPSLNQLWFIFAFIGKRLYLIGNFSCTISIYSSICKMNLCLKSDKYVRLVG